MPMFHDQLVPHDSWLEQSDTGKIWSKVPDGSVASMRFTRRCWNRHYVKIETTQHEDRGPEFTLPPRPPKFCVAEGPTADATYTRPSWIVKSDQDEDYRDSCKYGYFYDEANAIEWCEYLNKTRGEAK